MRHPLALAALAVAAVLSACDGGDPTGTPPAPGIRAVSGPPAADTVGATPSQSVVVEVRGEAGRAAPGVMVRFQAAEVLAPVHCRAVISSCGKLPGILVANSGDGAFAAVGSATTDAEGRAAVRVRFGTVAGEGKLVVTAPELGLQDTLRFTVRAGSAHQAVVAPRDTTVYIDTAFGRSGFVVDRFGNARPEAAVLSGDAGLVVQGGSVTGREYGAFRLAARYGSLPGDSVAISVVPRGTLAAVIPVYEGDSIVLVDLDGSNRRTIPVRNRVHGLDWAPDGSRLVASLGTGGGYPRLLHYVALDGARTPVFPGSTLLEEVQPVFSANGQWLFFMGWPYDDARQVWRARPDGSGREQLTNAETRSYLRLSAGPSPDGSKVAVSFGSNTGPSVYDIAAGRYSTLGMSPKHVFRWSPDGSRIAFGDGNRLPGLVNPDGSGLQEFVPKGFTHSEGQLDWSPDGRWILFRGVGWLEMLDVKSGKQIPLFHTSGYDQPVWKP